MLRLPTIAYITLFASFASAQEANLSQAVERAGQNAVEIRTALDKVPSDQRTAMEFLVEHMPKRDLRTLSADFLLRNVDLAYRTWKESKWQIPEDVFLNNILPHASINETRDDFRKKFKEDFSPLVKDAKSPAEAAAILNNKVFNQVKVKYSTKRRRADQGPFESIESGLASCTGLSVLLIDACRSVGVPARFAGTPLWADGSGNHSWVEVWDDGWHFTGAAEPTGMELDKGWFIGRCSKAQRDNPRHAIYAVSYRKTPTHFPLAWDRSIDYVNAVNVTDRYTDQAKDLPPNHTYAMFKTYGIGGDRCCTPFTIKDENGTVVFQGKTKDESFDGNDHTTVPLPIGASFEVVFGVEGSNATKKTITTELTETKSQLFAFATDNSAPAQPVTHSAADEKIAIQEFTEYLNSDDFDWNSLAKQSFANAALSKTGAKKAKELLVKARRVVLRQERETEVKSLEIKLGDHKMPFFYKTFGDKPANGRSLFISMHGGGNAPDKVNDRQWENQKKLYEPAEGVYVAPRAPTNTWNLWHEQHIMPMFDRLIEDMILFENVDPNRVYVMGYSAGGDGVYQLAPRMADRWSAAAMMAGHPNDAQPLNLRNIGFALFMGGKDGAYNRNKVAANWGEKLAALRKTDPAGYKHQVTIYPEKGHWMDGEDASALPWMAKFTRDPLPQKIVWRKDGNAQPRFYWLGADVETWSPGETLTAERAGQTIKFAKTEESPKGLRVYLNDDLLDLDQDVTIQWPGGSRTEKATRTISAMHASLTQRFDPTCVFSAVLSDRP